MAWSQTVDEFCNVAHLAQLGSLCVCVWVGGLVGWVCVWVWVYGVL